MLIILRADFVNVVMLQRISDINTASVFDGTGDLVFSNIFADFDYLDDVTFNLQTKAHSLEPCVAVIANRALVGDVSGGSQQVHLHMQN